MFARIFFFGLSHVQQGLENGAKEPDGVITWFAGSGNKDYGYKDVKKSDVMSDLGVVKYNTVTFVPNFHDTKFPRLSAPIRIEEHVGKCQRTNNPLVFRLV
jgi:hypothetical protein